MAGIPIIGREVDETVSVLAVELYFDEESERRVTSVWSALDAAGVPSLGAAPGAEYRPHVSLAVFADMALAALIPALTRAVTPCLGMPLALSSVGFFFGPDLVAFLGVVPTERLIAANHRVHSALADVAADSWTIYRPGNFVPHCTLAMGLPAASPVMASLAAELLPIAAVTREAHVVDTSSGRSCARLL